MLFGTFWFFWIFFSIYIELSNTKGIVTVPYRIYCSFWSCFWEIYFLGKYWLPAVQLINIVMKAKLAKMVGTWPLPECGKLLSEICNVRHLRKGNLGRIEETHSKQRHHFISSLFCWAFVFDLLPMEESNIFTGFLSQPVFVPCSMNSFILSSWLLRRLRTWVMFTQWYMNEPRAGYSLFTWSFL